MVRTASVRRLLFMRFPVVREDCPLITEDAIAFEVMGYVIAVRVIREMVRAFVWRLTFDRLPRDLRCLRECAIFRPCLPVFDVLFMRAIRPFAFEDLVHHGIESSGNF